MSSIVQITDHIDQALDDLHDQHRMPKINTLITALVRPIQALEDLIYALLAGRHIDTAIGVQLTILGRIVLEPRNGLSDADYRNLIRAKVAVLHSKGTTRDLITVARLYLNDATVTVHVKQEGRAAVAILVGDVLITPSTTTLLRLLSATAASGVRVYLETFNALDADSFVMGSVTLVDGTHGATETEILLDDASGFDESGSVTFSYGYGFETTVTYGGKSGNTLLEVAPRGASIINNFHARMADDTDRGFSSTGTPAAGGLPGSVVDS